MTKRVLALLAFALLQAPVTAWALKIQTLDLKRHYRFYYSNNTNGSYEERAVLSGQELRFPFCCRADTILKS
jgi:hypothetical protein